MLRPCFLPAAQTAIKHLAIAVGRSGRDFFHAVVLFRDSSGIVQCLEIDLEGTIAATPVGVSTAAYAWAVPMLDDDNIVADALLEQVVDYCESIGKEPRNLTYSFDINSESKLAPQGDNFIAIGADGFTCASLVLAIFQYLELPLLDLSTWAVTQEDILWQHDVIDVMRYLRDKKRIAISDEQLDSLLKKIPCVRYSPKMVIGACRVGKLSVDCQVAFEAGEECERWIDQSRATHN